MGNDTAWIVERITTCKSGLYDERLVLNSRTANRIAVQPDGVPWCIDANDNIFQKDSNSATGAWTQRAGTAKDIGIGTDGSVWIVGTSLVQGGYGMFRWNGTSWDMDSTGGGATRIAVGSDGRPWDRQ